MNRPFCVTEDARFVTPPPFPTQYMISHHNARVNVYRDVRMRKIANAIRFLIGRRCTGGAAESIINNISLLPLRPASEAVTWMPGLSNTNGMEDETMYLIDIQLGQKGLLNGCTYPVFCCDDVFSMWLADEHIRTSAT